MSAPARAYAISTNNLPHQEAGGWPGGTRSLTHGLVLGSTNKLGMPPSSAEGQERRRHGPEVGPEPGRVHAMDLKLRPPQVRRAAPTVGAGPSEEPVMSPPCRRHASSGSFHRSDRLHRTVGSEPQREGPRSTRRLIQGRHGPFASRLRPGQRRHALRQARTQSFRTSGKGDRKKETVPKDRAPGTAHP